jgi:hypothetical protein
MRSIIIAMVLAVTASTPIWAQGSGNSPASSSPSTAGPSGSQGSATIENQMITYEVLRQMAGKIAERVKANCECGTVLLPDPNSQSEIVTAKVFDVSVQALVHAYGEVGGQGAPPIHIEAAFVPTLSDVASLLTAIKSSAAYSNQNFQPTTQSMITLLSTALKGEVAVRTSSLPGDLDVGVAAVQKEIGEIEEAQKEAKGRIKQKQEQEDQKETDRQKNSKDKDKETKDKEEAVHKAALEEIAGDKSVLADVDKEFGALRTALAGTSAEGTILATIIKGKTLLNSPYSLLTISVDAAGGDTKVTHFFWRELIMPTPSPSYNGGAVVSFLLTDQAGNFQDADMLPYMYDFSKWKSPKVPKTWDFSPPEK